MHLEMHFLVFPCLHYQLTVTPRNSPIHLLLIIIILFSQSVYSTPSVRRAVWEEMEARHHHRGNNGATWSTCKTRSRKHPVPDNSPLLADVDWSVTGGAVACVPDHAVSLPAVHRPPNLPILHYTQGQGGVPVAYQGSTQIYGNLFTVKMLSV